MTLRLLVASHSKTLQRVLDIALSQQDVAMVTVASRTDALVAVGRHPFDATLIDADLPQAEGGYGLCRELRARATGPLPAVLMTSQEHPFDLAKAQQVGGAVGLAKPFATQALVLAVRQAVAESRPADGADGADAEADAAAPPAPDARAQHMAAIDEALAALAEDRQAAAPGPAAAPLPPPAASTPAFIRLDTGADEGPVQLPTAKAHSKPFFDDESTASRPFARGAAPVTVVRRPSNALRAQSRLDAPLPSVDALPALPNWGTAAAEPPPLPAESAVRPAPPRPQATPAAQSTQAAPPPSPNAAVGSGLPTPSLSMAAAKAASVAALAELRHQTGSEPPAGAHAALEGPLSRAIERQLAQILSQVVPTLVAQEIRRHLEPPPLPPGHGRSAEAPADAGD